MKLFLSFFLVSILFIYGETQDKLTPYSYSFTDSPISGSIEGHIILTPKNTNVRFGGGLYGRPARSSSSPTSDSVLVILTGNSSVSESKTELEYLNQINQQFQPNILPLKQGQTVRIQNSDPVYHNVFSLTSPHKFDVGRRPKGEHFDVTFEKPGVVDVFCDIHSNMYAMIYVLPLNIISVTKIQSNDNFIFSDIPEGNYEIRVVALGYSEFSQSVSVTSGATTRLETITLNP
ncbi:MAG: PEGA domain-containing protein [Balneola sp.]|nr:PEGA domain-containing protein [Balneola sp.]MBO6650078.1 PEGA domain-containing protein [Balneola sp.]MBO6710441.1 PEGA domain-containing protein [Balneola sp.]MBO6799126.1 PEGA domain-containing protein [Balneola sp.]MBO6870966.1 PEGA domain-containing protein [Balneola sp.]